MSFPKLKHQLLKETTSSTVQKRYAIIHTNKLEGFSLLPFSPACRAEAYLWFPVSLAALRLVLTQSKIIYTNKESKQEFLSKYRADFSLTGSNSDTSSIKLPLSVNITRTKDQPTKRVQKVQRKQSRLMPCSCMLRSCSMWLKHISCSL